MRKKFLAGLATALFIFGGNGIAKATNAQIYGEKGNEYYEQGHWSKAIDAYKKALNLNENNREGDKVLNLNIGNTYAKLEDYEKSIPYYCAAIEIDPKYADAYLFRAKAYGALRLYSSAYSDADLAYKYTNSLIEPQIHQAAYQAKKYYLNKRESSALTINDNNPFSLKNAATAYYYQKNYPRSIETSTRAIKIATVIIESQTNEEVPPPLSCVLADMYYQRGNVFLKIQDSLKAISDFTNAIKYSPNRWVIYHQRGFAHRLQGDNSGAVSDFSHALSLNPDSAETLYYRAISYEDLGNNSAALSDAKKALNLQPGNGMLHEFVQELIHNP